MTLKQELQKKLEQFPDFRERRFRSKYLSILALRKCGLEYRYQNKIQLTLEEMADFAKVFDSYRHEYDAVQKDNPSLRGLDYEDGKILAQEKQIEYGYYPGYQSDVKRLKEVV